MPNRRLTDRKKRRMPCELQIQKSWHSGLVLDLSPTGLFIQTTAKTKPGQPFTLVLNVEGHDPFTLSVEVVRKKVVPPRLMTLEHGGVGVRILSAPEGYYAFLREIFAGRKRGAAAAADEPEPCESQSFRVRLGQINGSRSRRLTLEAADASAAGELALEQMGDDWKVLEVQGL